MAKIDTNGWKEFKIGKLFEIKRPVARSQAKYEDGNIPLLHLEISTMVSLSGVSQKMMKCWMQEIASQ